MQRLRNRRLVESRSGSVLSMNKDMGYTIRTSISLLLISLAKYRDVREALEHTGTSRPRELGHQIETAATGQQRCFLLCNFRLLVLPFSFSIKLIRGSEQFLVVISSFYLLYSNEFHISKLIHHISIQSCIAAGSFPI